ncbi:hypothetical protein B9J09_05715 [Xylella fastidiosa subsp. pauca]|uniref:LamG-like jellyroll fold domain-containing protein n=1 Tax=Xylella fastidiosa TaxID=2371 RepID=UPI0005824961|nr:LamG-like jellyroll fold domain-containing protein [Xylella fastidiosa]ARO68589.1 hypothetical protein B9J09_05715 [Xylella fastidiosa subsp. pauca]AVI20682.1 hypothetical protein BCV75_05265 [Xylella fastidiosa]AVI22708.1 hypothetical protein BC375_05325 [Xylella fastidiosa]KIA58022.1 hypothetical protein RA12_05565 [Xylella fastidiosa]KXB11023.1 hypothetical protein ADT32_06780 [Xylella fastidiosa]
MTTIPHNNEPFLDASGLVTRSWRTYLSSLAKSDAATQLQQQIDALQAALHTAPPNGSSSAPNAQLLATGSINVAGTLSSGFVSLNLEGDARSPGSTSYYGTDATGVKGWHPVPVVSVNGNTGSVLLKVGTLADVDASGIADKKALVWDASANKHVYADIPSGGGGGSTGGMRIENIASAANTLTQSQVGSYLRFTYSGAKTVTVPAGLLVSSGMAIVLSNQSSGPLTLSAGAGMALNGSAGAFVLQQGEAAALVFLSSSEADVITASITGQASYTTAICVAFNGKNQWGDIASLPSSVIGGTPHTILALYNPLGGFGSTGTRQAVFSGGALGTPQLRIGAVSDETTFTYYESHADGSNPYGGVGGAGSATAGRWTAHAGKYDAGRCYAATHTTPWTDSGAASDTPSNTLTPVPPFTIARRYNAGSPDRYFNGYLHSLGVFNRALSNIEITDFFAHKDLTSINGLVSGWRFGTDGQTTVPNLVDGEAPCILSGAPDYVRMS